MECVEITSSKGLELPPFAWPSSAAEIEASTAEVLMSATNALSAVVAADPPTFATVVAPLMTGDAVWLGGTLTPETWLPPRGSLRVEAAIGVFSEGVYILSENVKLSLCAWSADGACGGDAEHRPAAPIACPPPQPRIVQVRTGMPDYSDSARRFSSRDADIEVTPSPGVPFQD